VASRLRRGRYEVGLDDDCGGLIRRQENRFTLFGFLAVIVTFTPPTHHRLDGMGRNEWAMENRRRSDPSDPA